MRERLVCKGALIHGTACGICTKCQVELGKLKNPPLPLVTEELLNQWEVHGQEPEILAIVKAARAGVWAYNHSRAINDALQAKMVITPMSEISKWEKALDSRPKELK